MPKIQNRRRNLIYKWFDSVEENCFLFNGDDVHCTICNKSLVQHINTQGHKQMTINSTDDTLSDNSSQCNSFEFELCQAFISANISWKALNNGVFNSFLKKYCIREIPDESTLRKNYLHMCYQHHLAEIRNAIKNEPIWISVDETTDTAGRYVANLIIGKLSEDNVSRSYLVVCKQLDQFNNGTISRFVNDGLRLLWPLMQENQVLLLVTDAASYMKAGENLKVFYSHMIHITCLAHGLNRIVESIRTSFDLVNSFISSVKKIFLKAPHRVSLYKAMLNGVELPPEPIITRWGTWIKAVVFYADNYEGIKEVIQSLDPDDASSIKSAQDMSTNPQLFNDLLFIKNYFPKFYIIIKRLEEGSISIKKALQIFGEAKLITKNTPGVLGEQIRSKLKTILKRNPDFKKLKKIDKLLNYNI